MLHMLLSTRAGSLGRVITVLATLALVMPNASSPARAAPEDASTSAEACGSPKQCLDRAAENYLREGDATAVQIAIWKQGRFAYSGAFGFADPARTRPVSPQSLFQVGSNGKKATALAVLRAVDAGRVRLDDPVARALPGFKLARAPGWTREATVSDLLSHQSGLWDYTPGNEAPEDCELQKILRGRFADQEWAPIPPGAAWNYSNANYAVLGAILEHAYGRSYPEIMKREVYAPLRLRQTYARHSDALASERAVWGYGVAGSALAGFDAFDLAALLKQPPWAMPYGWVAPNENVDNAFLRPAGGAWSTAEDECRIGAFLVEGRPRFLSEASREAMVNGETELTPGDPRLSYAFGLMVAPGLGLPPDEWYDTPVWTHSGATLTMASQFVVLPEQGVVISILRNARDTSPAAMAMLSTALQQYGALPAKRSAPPMLPDNGARYAGTYADPQGLGTITLHWDGAKLSLSAPAIEALGVSVDPAVLIERPNVLVFRFNERPYQFTLWPSAQSDAGYLVGREDSFRRVCD